MLTRRRVLGALGALPFAGALGAAARVTTQDPDFGSMRVHLDAQATRERAREQIDHASIARLCLPIRPTLRSTDPTRGMDPFRRSRAVFRTETRDIDLDAVDAPREALTWFVNAEERLFRSLIDSPIVDLDDLGDLRTTWMPGQTSGRGFDSLRHMIERHDVPADKLFVHDADFLALRERWGTSFLDPHELHEQVAGRFAAPESVYDSGFKGLLCGYVHVLTRSCLVRETFVDRGEALIVTNPEYLGTLYELSPLMQAENSPNVTDPTKDRWVSAYGMHVEPFRAYRARFPIPTA